VSPEGDSAPSRGAFESVCLGVSVCVSDGLSASMLDGMNVSTLFYICKRERLSKKYYRVAHVIVR